MDNRPAVAVTGIILQNGKYLITKRSLNKKLKGEDVHWTKNTRDTLR